MARWTPGFFLSYALPAVVAMLACLPVTVAAASHEALSVSARVITSCRMGNASRPGNVAVRCTGEVALQAGAGMPDGGPTPMLQVVRGVVRETSGARRTVLEAGLIGDDNEPGRIVTVLF